MTFRARNPTSTPPISEKHKKQIEELLGESLPSEFLEIYAFANGESGNEGLFFEDIFMESADIISQLQFSRSLIKPEDKAIENPKKSNALLQKIVDFYLENLPKKGWQKAEFECGDGSHSWPSLYPKKDAEDYENVEIASYDGIEETLKEMRDLEQKSYGWDKLAFVLYPDGKYTVERQTYDFDKRISFTSTPEKAIQKKYFHYKWLPHLCGALLPEPQNLPPALSKKILAGNRFNLAGKACCRGLQQTV